MVYTAFTVETLLVFVYKLLTNSVAQPAAAAAPRFWVLVKPGTGNEEMGNKKWETEKWK